MKITVVTTFAKDHIAVYGRRFIDTFQKHCAFDLKIFAEDFTQQDLNYPVLDYYKHIPEQIEFKQFILENIESSNTKSANRLRKALRWSYKSFVIWYALKNINSDYIVWMDADVETLRPVDETVISKIAKKKLIVANPELIKNDMHIESGFVIFNTKHSLISRVIEHYHQGYHDQQVLNLPKPWDGFWLAKLMKEDKEISNSSDLSKVPYRKIFTYFKHHVGKAKFRNTDLNKYLGRKHCI